jgi:hypothetical protein
VPQLFGSVCRSVTPPSQSVAASACDPSVGSPESCAAESTVAASLASLAS